MNQGFKNEISVLAGLTSLGLLLQKKNQIAAGLGLLALGLRFLPTQKYSFENKVVVITGGSRGLGLALAENLIGRNSQVALLARDEEELQRAQNQLNYVPDAQVMTVVCDVTNRNHLRSAFSQIRTRFGRIDVLINNAGAVTAGPFESMSQSDFESQMNVHFYAILKAVQLLLPTFKAQGEGRIVNISSIGGKIAVPHMSPYCASKFALAGFSQAISEELRKDNITVTTVYPGLMRTGSPIQGVFKGDHEKEFAWFAVSDSTPGLSMPARRAAQRILDSVSRNQTDVVISLPAQLATFVHGNFPELFNGLMALVNQLLPQGQSNERRTGAASRSWLDRQSWSQPFLAILLRAQRRYNEHEKFDPNLNLSAPLEA
jgi:short-subunit dehydrogenase